mmetsp:Transcript_14203/g.43585  ORF Transcript_14203/g.43585 Transcript_14203/m.43585 type:complete len:227 (+) Transcript_14203:122-802(+)|eukprot:scaffold52842_cov37-Tisochrysis_lutea.AAC.1
MLAVGVAVYAVLQLPRLVDLEDDVALRSSHFFSDTANWVVPGHVMQGRHPGSGRGSTLKRLTAIREEGQCGTFVCLQAELPPQDSSPSFGGAMTWQYAPILGFESYVQDATYAAFDPVSFVHFGINDMQPANELDELEKFVEHLAARVLQGEVLYVHCWGGKGRAGLVCACLLGLLYPELDGKQALKRVQAYCSLRNQGIGVQIKSPETAQQKQQVLDFYARRAGR